MPSLTSSGATTLDASTDAHDITAQWHGNRTVKFTRDGKGIVSFYDNLNREIYRNFPNNNNEGNQHIKYDLAGRLPEKHFVSTSTGIDYGYDNAKRLTGETSFGRTMTYGYDLAGNRNLVQWPDTNYISYSFDAMNRMAEVRENSTTPGVNVLQTYYWDTLSRRSAATMLSAGGWHQAPRMRMSRTG